jgi:thiol:disulfide interchange protein DsbD
MKKFAWLYILIVLWIIEFPKSPLSANDNRGLTWEKNLSSAIEKAKKQQKPLFIHFYTPWCPYCTKMQQETLRQAQVEMTLRSFINVMVNVATNQQAGSEFEVRGVPDNRVYNAQSMTLLLRIPGFMQSTEFNQELQKTLQHMQKTSLLLQKFSREKNHSVKQSLALDLANQFYKLEDYAKAASYFKQTNLTSTTHRKKPNVHKKYGFTLMATGNFPMAIAQFNKFLSQIDQKNKEEEWNIRFLLAYSQMKAGDKGSALKNFSLVSQNSANPEVRRDALQFSEQIKQGID